MRTVLLTISLLLALAAPLCAADHGAHFGDMDASGDGKVSQEEYARAFPAARKGEFSDADLNKDGTLDHDEWHAWKKKHGLGHGGKDAKGH